MMKKYFVDRNRDGFGEAVITEREFASELHAMGFNRVGVLKIMNQAEGNRGDSRQTAKIYGGAEYWAFDEYRPRDSRKWAGR